MWTALAAARALLAIAGSSDASRLDGTDSECQWAHFALGNGNIKVLKVEQKMKTARMGAESGGQKGRGQTPTGVLANSSSPLIVKCVSRYPSCSQPS